MGNKTVVYIGLLIFFLLGIGDSGYAQQQQQQQGTEREQAVIDSLIRVENSGAVIPFRDTLFTIYGDVGSATASKRALIVSKNIFELSRVDNFNRDSLVIQSSGDIVNIVYDGNVILGVTELQARLEEKPQSELTQEYKEIIASAVVAEKSSKLWTVVLKRILLVILILAVTWFAIKYLNVFYRKLRVYVSKQRDRTLKKIYFLIDADKQIGLAMIILKVLRFIAVVLILYSCLLTFFRLFPSTRWLSDTLFGYIAEPFSAAFTAIGNFIPDLFRIIIIIILFRLAIRAVRLVAEQIKNGSITIKGFHADWAVPTFNIVKIILIVFMFIFIFPYLPGSDSPAFQGVSVFMGVLFSLGSTSVISNMVSGLVITYMRPFRVGDRIKMGEYVGDVIEKTPLVTRLKTSKNEVITIPNATIMSTHTINYTTSAKNHGLLLYTTISVSYDIDWRKVQDLLMEAALNTQNVLHTPEPFVLQTTLDDFYAKYQINIYVVDPTKMTLIYSDLNKNIVDVFHREGVEMLAPHVTSLRDASSPAVPKKYVKAGFQFPTPFPLKVTKEQIETPSENKGAEEKE